MAKKDLDIRYIAPDGREISAGSGFETGGAPYMTLYRKRDGNGNLMAGYHRLKSKYLPLCDTLEQARKDLDAYIGNKYYNENTKYDCCVNGVRMGYEDKCRIVRGEIPPPEMQEEGKSNSVSVPDGTPEEIDISVTDVPKEERNCQNCGMMGCCPSMLAGKLTDLRGRKETPGSCNRWRDRVVMNPQRDPLDADAATCIDCHSIACQATGKRGNKVICDKIRYDGKQIATSEHAPGCLLFDREWFVIEGKEEQKRGADGTEEMGAAAGMAAQEDLAGVVPVAADPGMVRAIPGADADEQTPGGVPESVSVVPAEESAAVSAPERLQVLAAEIRFLTRMTVENAIAIGQRLNEAKEMVAHGEWGEWLKRNVHYSPDNAGRFMSIANEYANSATSRNLGLGVSALCELMALPKPEREEFMDGVHLVNGQEKRVDEMTVRELRAAIARRKRREEELEAQLETKRKALDQAYVDKSSALNALRDKMAAEYGESIRKLNDVHGKVVADLKEDLALKDEEISGMERPKTVTVEVDKVVYPPDYEAAVDAMREVDGLRQEVEATSGIIRQVLTRPDSMQLMDARGLGIAVDSFLHTTRAFPFSGPVLFSGDRAMRTDVFKVHLDKLGIWLAASYAALDGKTLEVAANAAVDD